jgi:hypothetical protein
VDRSSGQLFLSRENLMIPNFIYMSINETVCQMAVWLISSRKMNTIVDRITRRGWSTLCEGVTDFGVQGNQSFKSLYSIQY